MQYRTHGDYSEAIDITIIENGFIVTYIELATAKRQYFETLPALYSWLQTYYKEIT